jgi:hypothetical protein
MYTDGQRFVHGGRKTELGLLSSVRATTRSQNKSHVYHSFFLSKEKLNVSVLQLITDLTKYSSNINVYLIYNLK